MPTKRTLGRRYADLQRRYEQAIEERDDAVKTLAARKWVEDNLASSHDDLVIKRTRERDEALRRLRATEDELADARRRLADRPGPSAELRDARREVLLLRRQTAELTRRLEALQTANEVLSAGTAEVAQ